MPVTQRPKDARVLLGIILFGIAAVILGFSQLDRAIGGDEDGVPEDAGASVGDDEASQRTALAQLDTDRDGLSDLDELERYFSSPYLADSDSDGRTDKEELDAGENPNCPTGKTCDGFFNADAGPQRNSGGGVVPPVFAPSIGVPASSGALGTGTTAVPGLNELLGQLPQDPAGIRQMLVSSGMPAAQVESLSDEQIQALWEQALQTIRQQEQEAVQKNVQQ